MNRLGGPWPDPIRRPQLRGAEAHPHRLDLGHFHQHIGNELADLGVVDAAGVGEAEDHADDAAIEAQRFDEPHVADAHRATHRQAAGFDDPLEMRHQHCSVGCHGAGSPRRSAMPCTSNSRGLIALPYSSLNSRALTGQLEAALRTSSIRSMPTLLTMSLARPSSPSAKISGAVITQLPKPSQRVGSTLIPILIVMAPSDCNFN